MTDPLADRLHSEMDKLSLSSRSSRSSGSSGNYEGDKDENSRRKKTSRIFKSKELSAGLNLPQKFTAKFLGASPCSHLWGLEAIRAPVDAMIEDLKTKAANDDNDLALVALTVRSAGLDIRLHKANRSTAVEAFKSGMHTPLEFISYGVQDTAHPRIFVYIVVKELSIRERLTECCAYLCESADVARQMALSLNRSFELYAEKLKGRPFRFQVDLQPSEKQQSEPHAEEDC